MFGQIQIYGENTREFWLRLHPIWKCIYLKITFHKSKGKRRKSPTILILNAMNFKELHSHVLRNWNWLTVGWKWNLRSTLMEQRLHDKPLFTAEFLSECLIHCSVLWKILTHPRLLKLKWSLKLVTGLHIQMITQVSIQFSPVCFKTSCFDKDCQFQSTNNNVAIVII